MRRVWESTNLRGSHRTACGRVIPTLQPSPPRNAPAAEVVWVPVCSAKIRS
jgi:hypothetical protein